MSVCCKVKDKKGIGNLSWGKETVDGIDRDFATAVSLNLAGFPDIILLWPENRRSLPGDSSVEGQIIQPADGRMVSGYRFIR